MLLGLRLRGFGLVLVLMGCCVVLAGPGRAQELFDSGYYLRTNPDVAAAGIDPRQHFDQTGWRENRNPSPAFDTGYRAWGIFAAANGLEADAVAWQNVDPALRETLLTRGDVDAITGFYFTSLLNLEERGMSEDELTIMPFPDYGVPLYGNAILVSDAFADANPEAVQGFLRAFNRALGETLADPEAAIEYVRNRDGLIDVEMETRRLKLALESVVDTPDAREYGVGGVDDERLSQAIQLVADAYDLPTLPSPDQVFDSRYLPPVEERMLLPEAE